MKDGGIRECEQDLVGGGVWHRRICVGKREADVEEWRGQEADGVSERGRKMAVRARRAEWWG